ncbi:hypothetical protein, partial [Bacillus thuringiensis]|uniref:hypothetical protein n=1 Tax=Bacillus thuringiensis TaxID=1428 RepID=UPI001C550A0A
ISVCPSYIDFLHQNPIGWTLMRCAFCSWVLTTLPIVFLMYTFVVCFKDIGRIGVKRYLGDL